MCVELSKRYKLQRDKERLLQGRFFLAYGNLCKLQCVEVNYNAEMRNGQPGEHRSGVWGRYIRDNRWTGGIHEIRRISEDNGLVFSLLDWLVSRKTPNLTGLCTIYGALSKSITYESAIKQDWFSLFHALSPSSSVNDTTCLPNISDVSISSFNASGLSTEV